MGNSGKGSDYERELCKEFSKWWSGGKRDDIFWRASGSGGRAKYRGRAGLNTFGQHGDLCATDPSGTPLIDLFTIEIKRGYTGFTVYDLLDRAESNGVQVWDGFLHQAIESHNHAGSYAWLLIHRRNKKQAMVWLPAYVVDDLRGVGAFKVKPHPFTRADVKIRHGKKQVYTDTRIVGMCLAAWFAGVTPQHLKDLSKEV